MACPIRFSAGLPAPKHIGVAAGAHSAEVLAELGYSDEQVAALKAAGAVG